MLRQKSLLPYARRKDCPLEAEVGSIGGEEGRRCGEMGECADPQECKMIADLGVTMLAAGIGKHPRKISGKLAGTQL